VRLRGYETFESRLKLRYQDILNVTSIIHEIKDFTWEKLRHNRIPDKVLQLIQCARICIRLSAYFNRVQQLACNNYHRHYSDIARAHAFNQLFERNDARNGERTILI